MDILELELVNGTDYLNSGPDILTRRILAFRVSCKSSLTNRGKVGHGNYQRAM